MLTHVIHDVAQRWHVQGVALQCRHHRLSVALDAGLMFWGAPEFVLNGGKKIKSTSKESGITHFISWFSAYPLIQMRLAYKFF